MKNEIAASARVLALSAALLGATLASMAHMLPGMLRAAQAEETIWTPDTGRCEDAETATGAALRPIASRPGCGRGDGIPCCAYVVSDDCGASCDGGHW